MRRWRIAGIVAAGIVLAAAQLIASSSVAADVASPSSVPTFAFSRLVERLPAGAIWATIQVGGACQTQDTLVSDGLQREQDTTRFAPVISEELTKAGYRYATDGQQNLFESQVAEPPTFEIGAIVTTLNVKVCRFGEVYTGGFKGFMRGNSALLLKGSANIKLEWQVYSTAKREVVLKVPVEANFSGEMLDKDEPYLFVINAMAEATRQLTRSNAFQALRDAPLEVTSNARIAMRSTAIDAVPLADAVGSVVLLSTGSSFGSGVLVSGEGYLLTNAHVVGGAKSLTVRWSDGFEGRGEVVRVHQQRDVALVKVDPHGRSALPIRATGLQPGQTVVALGAPLEKQFQGTLTRGVVSATRILDGFSFIQSDVAVSPGNSGGPLMDESGHVVGLTVSGYRLDGASTGVNFFIPIKDALDFLSLDLLPPSTSVQVVPKL